MIPRTSIDEANRHLNMLHGRVSELEKKVAEQHEALIAKDEQLQNKLKELSSAKNAELDGLQLRLRESEQTVSIMQQQMQQKDLVIATQQNNLEVLETLLSHKTSVQNLLQAMKEAESGLMEVIVPEETIAQGPVPAQDKPDVEALVNGFNNGVLSSPENKPERQFENKNRHGEKRGKTKRLGGKEFYL